MRVIIFLWIAVAAVCALSTVGGYAVSRVTAERFEGFVDGFAAGALLVMLVGSMIPEATIKAGEKPGWRPCSGSLSPPACPQSPDYLTDVAAASLFRPCDDSGDRLLLTGAKAGLLSTCGEFRR